MAIGQKWYNNFEFEGNITGIRRNMMLMKLDINNLSLLLKKKIMKPDFDQLNHFID